jgi:hypothetical protein
MTLSPFLIYERVGGPDTERIVAYGDMLFLHIGGAKGI